MQDLVLLLVSLMRGVDFSFKDNEIVIGGESMLHVSFIAGSRCFLELCIVIFECEYFRDANQVRISHSYLD